MRLSSTRPRYSEHTKPISLEELNEFLAAQKDAAFILDRRSRTVAVTRSTRLRFPAVVVSAEWTASFA